MRWTKRQQIAALALPFLIGAFALRLAIAPIGDAIAGDVARATPPRARTVSPGLTSADVPRGRDSQGSSEPRKREGPGIAEQSLVPSSALRASEVPCDLASSCAAVQGTIVVPASAVTRAMKRHDVSATNAVAADGSPLGARLAGVSRYGTGLRDGDVVVSVAGTRTPTVAAMVSTAMQAAGGGATRLSGRIVRGTAAFSVVIELPQ
jgi:hypothetical protein